MHGGWGEGAVSVEAIGFSETFCTLMHLSATCLEICSDTLGFTISTVRCKLSRKMARWSSVKFKYNMWPIIIVDFFPLVSHNCNTNGNRIE